ncbi:spore coat protein [Marinicrinis lubricantis]|uniref:Spore coat protein n=1 Tax=Marinicrinis lubricantis TaxID=2086470 RepID=A0ABW1ILE7_9BACL
MNEFIAKSNKAAKAKTLAWHETLELHELVAFQSNALMQLKKTVPDVTDQALKSLYTTSIHAIEKNIKELISFFPRAPIPYEENLTRNDEGFYSGSLLGLAKTSVRSYAIAVTETATPELRDVLSKQLNAAVKWHGQVYNYMYQHGYYPSYDLKALIANDIKNAQKALTM